MTSLGDCPSDVVNQGIAGLYIRFGTANCWWVEYGVNVAEVSRTIYRMISFQLLLQA